MCFGDISTCDLTADQVLAPDRETLLHILEDRLARYSPSEIVLNPQALDLTGLADFIRDKLHAAVECQDGELYWDL